LIRSLDVFAGAALALCLTARAPEPCHASQDPVPAEPPPAAQPAVPRLDAWPAVPKSSKELLETELAKLRKAATPEMAASGRDGLIALGACAGPGLIKALAAEKDELARARLLEVLLAVTGAEHTRLLAREFGHKSKVVRCFALRRAAQFPDAATLEAASQALAAARRAKDPGRGPEEDERYLAALAVAAAGSRESLEELLAMAQAEWGACGAEIRAALEVLRGPEASEWALAKMPGAGRDALVAALHVLAGCGEKKSAVRVIQHLDSTDNGVRIAAINALRGVVDGAPPLERLSAFDAIEEAKAWKERLGWK
jgi:hypothetical protein